VRLTVAASGPARPDAVWERYIRPARWAEWSPQIRSVDYPDATLGAGGRGVVHGPCGVGVDFEILEVDSARRCWSWRVTVTGIVLILGHTVRARGTGPGTTTTLDLQGPAPLVLGYLPIARIALGRLVR
jgi:hypothetical protein